IMQEGLVEGFKGAGFEPEVRTLESFQDDYGLVGDVGDDGDEGADEDEKDDEGEDEGEDNEDEGDDTPGSEEDA
ncbi:hypothetical protein LTR33_017229, partial [Friedmanniomyces endolithicus]